MITALVQFKLPTPVSREKAAELFAQTAPMYREMQGLVRILGEQSQNYPDIKDVRSGCAVEPLVWLSSRGMTRTGSQSPTIK